MSLDLNQMIRDHVMLAAVHIKHSRFEIRDLAAARAAAEASGASSPEAYYAKKHLLFRNDARLRKLQSLGNDIRGEHTRLTMIWASGRSPFRMLPVAGFLDYTKRMNVLRTKYMEALDDFIAHYEEDAAAARRELNLGENAESLQLYPKVDQLKGRFDVKLNFEPIAKGHTFEGLPPGIADKLRINFETAVSVRYDEALIHQLDELEEMATTLRDNLQVDPVDDKAQRWHNSSVYNLVERARIMSGFDVSGKRGFRELSTRILDLLGGYDDKALSTLRKPATDRAPLITSLNKVLQAVGAIRTVLVGNTE